jgi:hypothetical protein
MVLDVLEGFQVLRGVSGRLLLKKYFPFFPNSWPSDQTCHASGDSKDIASGWLAGQSPTGVEQNVSDPDVSKSNVSDYRREW